MKDNQKKLYSIGEFSKQSGVSQRTIRHYEELGLITPCSINAKTQYREYSDKELFTAITINMMKNVFSLDKIKLFLNTKQIPELLPLYRDSKEDINQKIDELINIRERLDNRITVFENHLKESKTGKYKNLKPQIKILDERKLIFYRKKEVYDLKNLMLRSQKILQIAMKNNLYLMDPILTIFHDDIRQKPKFKLDYEFCKGFAGRENLELSSIKTIPYGLYATFLIKGDHCETVNKYYPMLLDFIEQQGFKPTGPLIKEFKIFYTHVKSSSEVVSELQIQVKKI